MAREKPLVLNGNFTTAGKPVCQRCGVANPVGTKMRWVKSKPRKENNGSPAVEEGRQCCPSCYDYYKGVTEYGGAVLSA